MNNTLSTPFDLIMVILLLLLLALKELVRSTGHPKSAAWMRILNLAILPLLLIFGAAVIIRFVRLLNLG